MTSDDAALSVGCFEFLTRLSQLRTGLSRTEHPLYLQYVRPAMQEIESHLSDPLNVDDLAEQLHITPQYLTRLFQRFVGSSVRSYISVLRISRAKELLISRPYTTLDGLCRSLRLSAMSATYIGFPPADRDNAEAVPEAVRHVI